jgi:hypothetical protein
MKISVENRYAITLSGLAFIFIGTLFLISTLVHFDALGSFSMQFDLFLIVIGSVMAFAGLLGVFITIQKCLFMNSATKRNSGCKQSSQETFSFLCLRDKEIPSLKKITIAVTVSNKTVTYRKFI